MAGKRRPGIGRTKAIQNSLARLGMQASPKPVVAALAEFGIDVNEALVTREELVGALVGLKTAINDANREAQRDIYDLAEKKATAQFLAGVNTRHGPQPPVYPSTTEVHYVAALKKADVDALVVRL